ncbi:hypothetical protein [Streptomyces boninensis]|uniref:hypothetical protein n=1 Tax=Streptomyces boninensis TaxID=2039455 RepID=UPI003B220EB7
MFEYELHEARATELHRQAAERRLAREAAKAAKAARKGGRVSGRSQGRQWVKAA